MSFHLSKGVSLTRCCFGAINKRTSIMMKTTFQQRQLHAQWTYLLDHCWLYKSNDDRSNPLTIGRSVGGLIESDTSCEDTEARTILFLHDAYADKSMGMNLAKKIINQASDNLTSSTTSALRVQNLMVNVRGSGGSSSDDYDNAHTLANAAEDVLTLIQTVCTGTTRPPSVIVAYGTLGKALAHFYVHSTVSSGGVTRNTHSEVTGEGAVTPPKLVLLLPGVENSEVTTSKSDKTISAPDKAPVAVYEYESDVSKELLFSTQEYLNQVGDISEQVRHNGAIVTTFVTVSDDDGLESGMKQIIGISDV